MIPHVLGLHGYAATPRITSLTYYGRGPEENYRDRRTSQFIGEYTSGIQDMYEPYVSSANNNHRTDIYWCTLTSKAKEGLLFVADRTFEMNIQLFSLEAWIAVKSIENGSPRTEKTNAPPSHRPATEPSVDLFIDYRMMGVGGGTVGELLADEPYLILTGRQNAIQYGFAIVPFRQGNGFQEFDI